MIGNKSSIYNAQSVYNQGGDGGGANVPFDPYYLRSSYVENNEQTFLVYPDKLEQQQNNKSMFGFGALELVKNWSEINELEIALHANIKNKYPLFNHGETWVFTCGFDAASNSWIDYPQFGMFVRKNSADNYARVMWTNSYINTINDPLIYDNESRVSVKFVRSENRIYTKINNNVVVDIINASANDGKVLRVGYGIMTNYDQNFIRNTIIYNKGTFVKVNGALVWGHEE